MSELTEELKLQFKSYDNKLLNSALVNACRNGQLEVVEYLLTSSELKPRANIHAEKIMAFDVHVKMVI